jgi:integrase/recombinase XerD
MSSNPLIRRIPTGLRPAVEDFLLSQEVEGRAPKTLRFYRQMLAHLVAFTGDLPPDSLDAPALRRFLAHVQQQGHATRTQRHIVGATKTFIRWLVAEGTYGLDSDAWLSRVKPPRLIAEQTEPLSPAEVDKLLASIPRHTWLGQRLRAIVALLLDTGLRASECCGLALADLDITTGEIKIRAATAKDREVRRTVLGLKARREVQRYFQGYRHDQDQRPGAPFFLTRNETAIDYRTLHRMIQQAGQKAGIPDLHPHRLRHTFTRACIIGGMDLFTVQRLLGHSDLTMTRKYFEQHDADVTREKLLKSPLDHYGKKR